MRGATLALLVACGFHHGVVPPGGGDDAPGTPDARQPPDGSGSPDTPFVATCGTTDPALVWCLEFDEPGLANATVALDGSGLHHDPAISNVGVVTRTLPASSQAIATTASSSITLAKPSDFNLQAFTLSAWVSPFSSNELGIIDTEKQYTLSINSANQTVECAVTSGANTTGYGGVSVTAQGEWDLVACTFDGQHVCSFSFRNGSTNGQPGCANHNTALATAGTTSSVGEWVNGTSHFVGAIDQVRLYSRALSETELCVAGGISGC
jgi:hypothetical protein